jgi:hypothetical protein
MKSFPLLICIGASLIKMMNGATVQVEKNKNFVVLINEPADLVVVFISLISWRSRPQRFAGVNHIANELMGLDWEFYSIEEGDQL